MPPTRMVGSSPASSRTMEIIAEVVVLPCVPGDADGALLVDDRAEHLGALHDADALRARGVDLRDARL